jgi:hypothetical protein
MRETNNRKAADYLIRAVLDDEFRKLALTNPEPACAEYTLTAEEQDILRSQDERMLALLGVAIRDSWSSPSASSPGNDDNSANEPAATTFHPIPPAVLRLRLVPQMSAAPEGGVRVQYAATLLPWLDASGSADPASGDGTSPDPVPGEINLLIRIFTTQVASAALGDNIACSVAIEPLPASIAETSPPATVEQSGPLHPFGGPGVQSAAIAVREAPPTERYGRLLDLLHALQPGVRYA